MDKHPAAEDSVLGHLARLTGSSSDRPGTPDAFRPAGSLRQAAAGWVDRYGVERLLPVGVCALLVAACIVSALPNPAPVSAAAKPIAAANLAVVVPGAQFGQGDEPAATGYSDLYLGDGTIANTMQNPGHGLDATTLLRTYSVKSGDTLSGIANRFELAMPTVYWANSSQISDVASLHVGQQLTILPFDGLLVKVGKKDTPATLAKKYNVLAQDIIDTNNLPEDTLTVGQTLLIPGASGGALPTSKHAPRRVGSWVWPVAGDYTITQYYWSGHRAIDIAARTGTQVVASSSGIVVFAGWKGANGGGNAVWVKHGTKLYTTYNHMSKVIAHAGQRVVAGQVLGLVGMTGHATGPHLHFEVWLGMPWDLGSTSDAVNPCRYLSSC